MLVQYKRKCIVLYVMQQKEHMAGANEREGCWSNG